MNPGSQAAKVHPGVLTERGGVHVHHSRVGERVGLSVVSGEALEKLRKEIERFGEEWRGLGTIGASSGDGKPVDVLFRDLDRLEAELDRPLGDVGTVERTAFRLPR